MESILDRYQVAAKRLAELSAAGFEIEECTDFDAVERLSKAAGRERVMPTFAIAPTHFTERSGFWLFLKRDGKYVAGVAACLQDLGRERLSDYLVRTYRSQFPHSEGETILKVAEPIQEYTGRLVYVGELARSLKGDRAVLSAFMRVLQLIIVAKWDFEAVYAFIPQRHYDTRLDRLYSFNRTVERAQVWNEPAPNARSSGEYFIASTRVELANSISAEAESVLAQSQGEIARVESGGILEKSSQ